MKIRRVINPEYQITLKSKEIDDIEDALYNLKYSSASSQNLETLETFRLLLLDKDDYESQT